jgi:Carboxypeptidase regulatory-like domain
LAYYRLLDNIASLPIGFSNPYFKVWFSQSRRRVACKLAKKGVTTKKTQWKDVAVLAMVSLHCAIAQTTGVVRGTVKDPSGAVIGGAKITAIVQATNATRTATSDIRGEYVFPTLPVGKYTVEIEAPGFKK